MGFGKYKDEKAADLVHKIELFDFETGDPALHNGRRQFFIVRGGKSRGYQNAIEKEAAHNKRKGADAESFTFEKNAKSLARRLAEVIVAAYVDVGDGEVDLIEFNDIDSLTGQERDQMKARLRNALTEITDLALLINAEVVKDANFMPQHGKTLSSLLNNESGTTPQPVIASQAA